MFTSDPYLHYPDEGKTYKYVIQRHYRGQSAHLDFRMETDQGYLIGWTLMDAIEGKVIVPVLTLKEARLHDAMDIWKFDWEKGEVKEREISGGVIRPANIRATEKKPEPLAWFDVEGVTPPGTVGATREFPGVFSIIDKGTIEYGAQKPYFHEYFLSDGKLKGRFCFRIIGRHAAKESILPPGVEEEAPRTPYFWVMMQPIDQTPYVLSDGAIDKKWLPPKGTSALPKVIRKNVLDRLQFWKAATKDALEQRKELASMEELNIAFATPPSPGVKGDQSHFVLQHHWWRGPIVIRFGPSTEHWDLRVKPDSKIWHLVLKNNPLDLSGSVMGYEKPCTDPEAMKKGIKDIEELEPGTEWNPTKDTPAFIKALDHGNCTVLEDSDTFKKIEFKGEHLRGLWTFTREDPESDLWIMARGGLPKARKGAIISSKPSTRGLFFHTVKEGAKTMEEEITIEQSESPPSDSALSAIKEALSILQPLKDQLTTRVQYAIDVIAGAAGYGYPEAPYPKPYEEGEYPKPYSEEVQAALKKALAKLQPIKAELSDRVKYAIDVLAGAAGYGYPEPYAAKEQLAETTLSVVNEVAHVVEVTAIKPGLALSTIDGKRVSYPDEVLQASLPLWAGATCFCDHFNKSVRNIAGVYFDPWWDDGVKAKLRILDENLYRFVAQLIKDREAGLPVPNVGISSDLLIDTLVRDDHIDVTQIVSVISADIVFSPAAGGSFDRVLNAAGIQVPQTSQDEGGHLVPESRVRDLQSTADKLRALNSQFTKDFKEAVAKHRELLLNANPMVPEDLVHGETIKELEDSVANATKLVEEIKSKVAEAETVPAGAPARGGPDWASMSTDDKVKFGLAHPPK